jgi:O-acetylhomoserine (thiol)-lyase
MSAAMADDLIYSDDLIRRVLARAKVIALVGASANSEQPSHNVMKFLQDKGYRVIPVNPGLVGQKILDETVYPNLQSIPDPIDMVDIFRRSQFAGEVVDEAIAVGAKIIWMQLGVRDDAAAARASTAGLTVIMNRCPKIEYGRLRG